MKVGDNVKLIKTGDWEGWGFEDSIILNIGRNLIQIKSCKGHTMYVKPNEIKLI